MASVRKISISRKNAARSFCLGVRGILVGLSLATFGAQGALSLEPSVLLRSKMPRPHDGVPNFHAVSERLYRSAQPTRNGFRELAAFGVKTVVSLRAFHADEPLLRGTEIDIVTIPMHTWHIERRDVVAALRAIRAAERRGLVLLHCQHGADRTGLISALYRILFQGWTKEAALAEMHSPSFGYHAIWGNIPTFIQRLDVEALRREVEAP